ncbi:MAG: hypothetical protein WC767_01550 [Candidatus Paceibacterota bacterium]|jgi:uncharacterized membrane protein YhaH (DUF805 family)
MKHFLGFSERVGNFNLWRRFVNFWTFIFLSAIVYDFFNRNVLVESDIMIAIAAIYCAALAVYSAEKEFRRWHHMHKSMHPGEVYALIWTIFIIIFIIAQASLQLEYRMPPEVSASYIAVISILAITRESKNLYKNKKR